MNDVERAFYTLDGWLTGQHVDLGRAHDALEQLRAALAAERARAETAEKDRDKWKGLADWARAELVERTSEYTNANRLADDRQKHNEWLRSVRATERMQAMSVQERAAELEAALERVEEYAEYCIAATAASEFYATFAEWLAQQSEVQS